MVAIKAIVMFMLKICLRRCHDYDHDYGFDKAYVYGHGRGKKYSPGHA
jgi:hypothetical protein